MIRFNDAILKGLPPEDHLIAKTLAAFIFMDEYPFDILDPDSEVFTVKPDLYNKVGEVLSKMAKLNIIEYDYQQEKVRCSLKLPFVVTEAQDDAFISTLRATFSKANTGMAGYNSDKLSIQTIIDEWRKRYVGTNDEIISAAKAYILDHKNHGKLQYMRRLDNFILTEKDSLLATWIEEVKATDQVVDWRTKIG